MHVSKQPNFIILPHFKFIFLVSFNFSTSVEHSLKKTPFCHFFLTQWNLHIFPDKLFHFSPYFSNTQFPPDFSVLIDWLPSHNSRDQCDRMKWEFCILVFWLLWNLKCFYWKATFLPVIAYKDRWLSHRLITVKVYNDII